MRRVNDLPPAFARYDVMGGAVEFAVFEQSSGSPDELVEAIAAVVEPQCSFDPAPLRARASRSIDETTFLGDWYDPAAGALLKVGDWRIARGKTLHDPPLASLDGVDIRSGAAGMPEVGSGGQFAYAFSNPPYSLQARPSEIQRVFDDIRAFILPPGHAHDIRDWSSPRLTEVSDYFDAGLEWRGVFLFAIHTPALGRLTAIAASTTD